MQGLLAGSEQAGQEDRETEDEEGGVDSVDPATSLTAEGMDDAITDSMRDRLAAIDRALKRLDDGSYGRSVRSSTSPTACETSSASRAAGIAPARIS